MKELERQSLLADQATVRSLLAEMPESDPLGRLSFTSRLEEIERQLAALEQNHSKIGSVALMFSGGPVHGSRAIDAGFASTALQAFNDLVTKKVASEEIGRLGARGRIPVRSEVNLAVTDIVRGSIGFVLEEVGANHEIADTVVKNAIDEISRVVVATGSESHDDFERAVESLDSRLLVSLRAFFRNLDEKRATLRIVEGDSDRFLDTRAVSRARQRIDMIDIREEESEQIIGELLGILPSARRFEMKLRTGEVIKGAIAASVGPAYMTLIETPGEIVVGQMWRAKMRIREITERNREPRKLYTLIGLLEQVKPLNRN